MYIILLCYICIINVFAALLVNRLKKFLITDLTQIYQRCSVHWLIPLFATAKPLHLHKYYTFKGIQLRNRETEQKMSCYAYQQGIFK